MAGIPPASRRPVGDGRCGARARPRRSCTSTVSERHVLIDCSGMTDVQVTFTDGLWNGRPVRTWVPDVVDDVVRRFDPVRIIVLGSVARGDEHDESDLDLLVLFDRLEPTRRRQLMGKIRSAIRAPIPIDVLIAEIDDFDRRRDVNGSPYFWPSREGTVVYERPAA